MAAMSSLLRQLQLHRCRFWPWLITLALIIVFLQLIHMALLSRLEDKDARQRETSPVGRQLQGRMFRSVLGDMLERVKNSYRFDKSGTYHVLDNFLTSEHVVLGRGEYDVSIVTHSTSNNLHHLANLSERWKGPLSVSVFTYDDDFAQTVSSLIHYHFCNDHIYRHVSFHLVYPISRAPKHLEGLDQLKLSCPDHTSSLTAHTPNSSQVNYSRRDLEYPNNLLRNLAINYALTPYIFAVDIDMVPSENLREQFHSFMSSGHLVAHINDSKERMAATYATDLSLTAYVVPVFEALETVAIPKTKPQLLDLWLKGLVRPFYLEACKSCQRSTDYDRWRTLNKSGPMKFGYQVTRVDPWEPFYIAKTSLPLYDERFKQYGFNRISQICEMHVNGFNFYVLDNAFLVHKGFKEKDKFHTEKDAENTRNRILYRKFKEELKIKYPNSTRKC